MKGPGPLLPLAQVDEVVAPGCGDAVLVAGQSVEEGVANEAELVAGPDGDLSDVGAAVLFGGDLPMSVRPLACSI